jgi:quercetin dioxygenase-like cupin family protein
MAHRAAHSLLESWVADVKPDLIAEYLLGEQQPASRRDADEAAQALALPAETLAALAPSPSLRARLLDTVSGVERFAPFFEDLTRLFQLPLESIRRLLARIDGRQWETTLLGVELQGAELFHFAVGPALAATGGAGGVVRIRPQVTFPMHRHHGDETTYVLEGGYTVEGRTHGPGSVIEMSVGTEHDYRAAPGKDLVLMVLHRGITILGA